MKAKLTVKVGLGLSEMENALITIGADYIKGNSESVEIVFSELVNKGIIEINNSTEMTLTYLNAVLDPKKEHELFKITPKGFNVEINYKSGSWLDNAGTKQQIFENATEVHHLFKDTGINHDDSIAFESDLRGEGFVRKVADIESVIITLAE